MPVLIHAANANPLTRGGNNTWLLDGDEPVLVDAGVGATDHVEAIASALDGRPLAKVLVTHGHPDHAGGVPALKERWPAVIAQKFLLQGESGWHPIVDGQRITAGGEQVRALWTPGHAADHVCFWNERTRELFAGDMVIAGTTVMIPFGRGGNLADYLRSLEKMAELAPIRIFPGHGPVIEDPATLIREYIDHRVMRERQILECLSDGVTEVEAIVERVYPDLAPALRPAAALTVEAHLEKIRADGR